MEAQDLINKETTNPPTSEKSEGEKLLAEKEDQGELLKGMKSLDLNDDTQKSENENNRNETTTDVVGDEKSLVSKVAGENVGDDDERQNDLKDAMNESIRIESKTLEEVMGNRGEADILEQEIDEIVEPVFDGTEVPGLEANRSASTRSLDLDLDTQKVVEKAVALKNLVKEKGEKGAVVVSSFLRRLSGARDRDGNDATKNVDNKDGSESASDNSTEEVSQRTPQTFAWNPFTYLTMPRDIEPDNAEVVNQDPPPHIAMKGRIILYTRLQCQESKEARLFLHRKRLKYVEINIDVYPSRKAELNKIAGNSTVPKLFFNEILIGGLGELKGLDESGKLSEKIDYLITEAPSFEAPLPPLPGEDDLSNSRVLDKTALIIRKLKEYIVPRDRIYKLRWFTNCFLGSEAVDFISEDQYLEREEAVEFGRKLAYQLFFQHVTNENLFEDGDHLYRFLDDDPAVSQCHNIPRGITDIKPKAITEIASRLRFLSYAIFEAYTSEDGKHVDYLSISGSEEFARYLRIVEELQRVELQVIPREEKLAFFINLYNMMAIHAILLWGHPTGNMERRRLFGEFRYVIGGSAYSLSSIQNGILRGNQRPPYNLVKPFGANDRRAKVALPSAEPLIHFTLVSGNESGPALRCYSPGDIDKELKQAASNFLGNGGLIIDVQGKAVFACKILKWYSIDFGKSEVEVLKYLSNYLDPAGREALLECLSSSQLKVIYQPYDWRLNC